MVYTLVREKFSILWAYEYAIDCVVHCCWEGQTMRRERDRGERALVVVKILSGWVCRGCEQGTTWMGSTL